jgi:integrase
MKLTDGAIARLMLANGEDEHIWWDDDLPGFGFRLRRSVKGVAKQATAKGTITRRWICQYRPAPRRTRRMTLKGAPGIVRAAQARAWAKDVLAKAHLHEDPQAARIAARRAVTFIKRAEAYLNEVVATRRMTTQDAYTRHLLKHAKGLHTRALETITRSEIAALLSRVARENGLVQSNRVRRTLSAFFAWCMREHELGANPVIGTRVAPEVSRERVLSDQELAAIWAATEGMATDHDRIVRLLMLTGCRRTEIGAMRWSEIVNGVFVLPAERSKNHAAHSVPLHWLALAQLPARPTQMPPGRTSGRELVFGMGALGFRGWANCKTRLDAKLGFDKPWRLHDLRRSCATWMAENNFEPAHIDAVLNHRDNVAKLGIRRVYNRASYEGPKKAALMKWGDHIASLTGQNADNVTALSRSG